MKTNGKRNRSAGHKLERDLVKLFKKAGFTHTVTTRSESKSRDDQKVDLMNKNEYENGRLPYNVQAKTSTSHLSYAKILSELPETKDVVNVIIHRQTTKVGERFLRRGEYAILNLNDFMKIIKELNEKRTS